jgi:nicotinate-nucleotide--dimethylbenzimidazole phosphoribosyltransferase
LARAGIACRDASVWWAIFAANHGVAERGVSAFLPKAVTRQMVENFAAGGAAINQVCIAYDLGLKVFELRARPADAGHRRRGCVRRERLRLRRSPSDGGRSPAASTCCAWARWGSPIRRCPAAVFHALYGGEAFDWVGRGTGVDDAGLERKAEAVAASVARIGPARDPLEVLRRVGGREIAAMVGAILAARMERVPVIVDGFVTTAAAAIVHAIRADAIDHCLFAHCSAEAAHGAVMERMGKIPLFDFGMRLGEGSGAALAAGIVKAAAAVHNGMATFEQAGVAGRT